MPSFVDGTQSNTQTTRQYVRKMKKISQIIVLFYILIIVNGSYGQTNAENSDRLTLQLQQAKFIVTGNGFHR